MPSSSESNTGKQWTPGHKSTPRVPMLIFFFVSDTSSHHFKSRLQCTGIVLICHKVVMVQERFNYSTPA